MTAPPLGPLILAAGPNVRIRLRVPADGPDEFRWRSDPETARFDGRAPNKEPLERFLDAFAYELAYGRNDREQFALDAADGRHIGTLMLYNFAAGGDSAELGISLGEEQERGHGFGREALILLLRWVWHNRPLRSVSLHALEWNERAIRAFRAVGFHESARVIRDGQVLLRMEVRREWWLLWETEGRFGLAGAKEPHHTQGTGSPDP
ncbi:MAG: GNAT family N-acetyltransferase [Dehalococcoidia bacterium]|nr:GNAT family N-acetyltransferase [Dehalococcoidia bacterium]